MELESDLKLLNVSKREDIETKIEEVIKETVYTEGTECSDKGRQPHGAVSDPEEVLDAATLTEHGTENIKPSVIKKLKYRSVLEGEATTFRCKLVARPPPTILWFHNNKQIQKELRHKIQTASKMHVYLTILTINNIKDKDSGSYKIMAFNTEGSAESTASLLVSLREEQGANMFSLSRCSDRSCSSLDSLVDQTKERKIRVDLRCVGSPFDKTSKGQSRGHHRHKSSLFRTMYFRTSSPSRAPEKDSKLETASERARSPPAMFERPERFSDRYSDIYCDRLTGRDRYSDRFSDKFSDRCSDRYSDRFSDTDSLHGEVRAKLNLLQKAVKKKKRLSVSTMSSTEFDLESVTSETSYTDLAERHRVKPSTFTDFQHARQSDQGDGASRKPSADFQCRLERTTGLGTQSVEPTQSRVKHSFEPQSRSRAIQMMRGELPLEDTRTRETTMTDISEIKIDETAISKERMPKEIKNNFSGGTDSICRQWQEESEAKEPFVLQWLEAGEVSQNIPKAMKSLHAEPTFKEPSSIKPLTSVKEPFLSDIVTQKDSKLVPIQQLQPRAMSIENVFEKNLESECLESEEQFLAERIRKWQEGVQSDKTIVAPSQSSEAKVSTVHEFKDKMPNEPQEEHQKVFSITLASPKDEGLVKCEARQKASEISESEFLISENVIKAQSVAWQQAHGEVATSENLLYKTEEMVNQTQSGSERDFSFRSLDKKQPVEEHHQPVEVISGSSFTHAVRPSVVERLSPEQGTQIGGHSSQAVISDFKSVLLRGEADTLSQVPMAMQHDKPERPKQQWFMDKGTQSGGHSPQVVMPDFKSESVLLIGERETLTQGEMKWQHDNAEGATRKLYTDKEPHVHKAEYGIPRTEPSTSTEGVLSLLGPSAKEKLLSEHKPQSEQFLMQHQMSFKNKSELVVSGEEAIDEPGCLNLNQRHADTEKASPFHRSEGEKYKKPPPVVPQRDSTFIKVSRSAKDKDMHEHGPRGEPHLSRERINELKNRSDCYVSEEEALTQRIMQWQHDVLSEQEHAVPLESDWVTFTGKDEDTAANQDVEPSKSSQSLPKGKTKEMFYTEDYNKDYGLDTSKMQTKVQSVTYEDSEKLQTESDYLVSEQEALATRIKKWQKDVLTEQEQEENVDLDSSWTITENLQPLTSKTNDSLEPTGAHVLEPTHCGITSKALFEVDKVSTHLYEKDLLQDNSEKWTETQESHYEKSYQGVAKGMDVCAMTEPQNLLSKHDPTIIVNERVETGAPVFLTTLQPNIKVKRGEMTDLKCQFHGDPKPVICWFKDGQSIIRDPDFDVRTREKSSTLTIYYPTKDHEGTFTCNISNNHGKASMSCMLEVTDDEPSDWPETPQEIKMKEEIFSEEQIIDEELETFMTRGVDKKFSLQVPHPVIHVPCPSDAHTHSSVEIRITAPTPVLDTSEDIFEPIARTTEAPPDEGTSQTMKHKFIFSFDDIGQAPQIFKPIEDIICPESQSAILECVISGEPSPDVTWWHDDHFLDPSTGKYNFDEHEKIYRLYINNFTSLDEGTYKCTATNKFGQVQSVANVFFDSTTLSNIGSLPKLEMTKQLRSGGFSSKITPAVRPKTLTGTCIESKELQVKEEEMDNVTPEENTQYPMSQFIPVNNEPSVLQKGAPKLKKSAQSQGPLISGCGLQSSGADVSVSKLKQAFEPPKSFIVEADDITVESYEESYYPVEDIPELALQLPQHEGLTSSNIHEHMRSSLVTCKESQLSSDTNVKGTFISKSIAPSTEETSLESSSDLHHFVSLAHVTEVQQSPTLIRPQAILPEKMRTEALGSLDIKNSQVETVIKKGTVGAFIRPGGSHLETDSSSAQETLRVIKSNKVELPAQSKMDTVNLSEKCPHVESGLSDTQECDATLTNMQETAKTIRVKQKTEGAKKGPVQEFATETLQQQQQKAVSSGASGIRLEEEEVTFSAVYDYYNPPSDWGRPLSPESEMSIEVGSTFSEEIAEIERFYTPASSTEISQFPKSPESFHTSTETPSGAMTPPAYPFSLVQHKRPSSSASDGLYSPTKFLRSPDDEGIESTPPVFTIDESMILPEGRDLLGLGSLQEKVQGIPPAFLKPLTKKRVFEGDTLKFWAEVFGLPSPEVQWFRNKTRLVPDDRTRIERDGDNISLEIHNIAKTDQGEYICEAVNYVGEAKSVALVVIRSQETKFMLAPPAVTHQHVIEFDVEEDEDPSRSPSPQEILLEVELDENEVKEFEKHVKIVTIPEYTSDNKSMIISLDVLPSTYDEGTLDFIAQESDDYKIAFEVTEMPPRFINPICDIETPENTTVLFECSLMGIPSPIVSWYKGNFKIPHDKNKYIHSSDGDNHFLKILKVSTQDSGIYTCRAINVVGETLCRASLMVLNPQACSGKARGRELTAVSLGSAIVQPQKFDLVVGNSSFDGEQPSEIELEFEFPQEADESQKAVRLVAITDNEVSEQGEKYVSINFDVFAEPSKEDKVEFKGKSTNMCSFHFQVTETPPKCIIPLQNVTAAVGTPVMLQCLVSGKPNPTAEWFKDGAPVTIPRYIIQKKASGHFNLLITNAVQSDAGEFKCVIKNTAGCTETMALLQVI